MMKTENADNFGSEDTFDHVSNDPEPEADETVGEGNVVVAPGNCLHQLAATLGLSAEALAALPENQALAKARSDLGCLLKGDQVYVPKIREKWTKGATGARHTFTLKVPRVTCEVRVLRHGLPLKDKKATLLVERQTIESKTDAGGWFRCEIPATADYGTLTVDGLEDTLCLEFGYLAPHDHIRGVQARLANLGLYNGKIDGCVGPKTKAALSALSLGFDIDDAATDKQHAIDRTKEAHGETH